MNPTAKQPLLLWLLFFASIALLGYTSYRAWVIPMTHDESATWVSFHQTGFWECLKTPHCWTNANNHLLNTALFQAATALFGQAEWVLRLPNVLAHALYLGTSIYVILQLTNQTTLGLAGWVLFNLNPYLLEFFSVARGYGLAMGFTLLSVAFLVAFIKRPYWGWAVGIFVATGLSVLSNFTQLNFLLALWLVYGLVCWQSTQGNMPKIVRWQWPPLLVIGVLGVLLWRPIRWLQSAGEFEWGVSKLQDTFWLLTADSLYQQGYFSAYTIQVFVYSLSIITVIILWRGLRSFAQKEPTLTTIFFGIACVLFLSVVCIMVMQRAVLGTEYLVNRKALLFIPLWACLLFGGLLNWPTHSIIQKGLAAFLVLAGFLHFSRCLNTQATREWWYDQYTLDMLQYLETHIPAASTIRLGVHWKFYPASLYYQQTDSLGFLAPLQYDKAILPAADYDYYYVFKKDYERFLQEGYEIEAVFEFAYLLRKKG